MTDPVTTTTVATDQDMGWAFGPAPWWVPVGLILYVLVVLAIGAFLKAGHGPS